MKFKLNKKGYMLVEIILASAIAFGLAFFIIDLTIKLKNKNDDLMVETLMNTDKTIINNKLMSYAKDEGDTFNCNNLTIDKESNTIKYNNEVIDIVNEYANIGNETCSTSNGQISIKIPISVPQMPDKEYDIIFDYKYEIGDMIAPTCSLTTDGTTIKATYGDEGGSGIIYYGWDSTYTGNNSDSKAISVGTHTYYVIDKAKNSGECNISIIETNEEKSCPSGYTYNGHGTCWQVASLAVKECSLSGNFTWSEDLCLTGTYDYSRNVCKSGNGPLNGYCYYYKDPTDEYTCNTSYTKVNDSYCYK